jgi:branched-chain amino acid transport system substrate-binding protein
MTHRLVLLLVLVGLIAAGCGGSSSSETAAASCTESGPTCVRVGLGQPLYLGTLLFESDPIGVDVARSLRLAIDYLDGTFDGIPGQLLGHDVSVVAEDDGCSAVGGRTGAIRLLQEPALVAVIGTSCSSAAFGAADVTLEKDNVLLLSASNTAPGLTDSSTHERNYFRIAFNDIIQGSTVADFAFTRQQWATAISVHKEDDAYSTQLTEAFTQSFLLLGGTSLSDLGVSESLPPAAVQRAVAKAQPAFVFIAEFTPVCDEIAAAIRQAPSTRDIPIVVSEACQTPTFLKTLGADANGIYTSGPDFSTVRESEFYNTEYLPAYRRLTGGDPIGVFHPTAWDTANLLFDAIRRTAVSDSSGVLTIDREALRRALLEVRGYEGLSGRLSCTSSGDCAEGARIAIYRAPNWPVNKGDAAEPIFSQLKTLSQIKNGG